MKERLVPALRAVKHSLLGTAAPARVAAHRLAGAAVPGSKTIGSPRRLMRSLEEAARALPGAVEFRSVFTGAAPVPAPVATAGTPPAGRVEAPQERRMREYVATLRPARFFVPRKGAAGALIAGDDALVVDCSDYFGDGFGHPVFRRLSLPPPHRLSGRCLYLVPGSIGGYYHMLFDVLPRMRLLELSGMRAADFDHVLMWAPRHGFERDIVERCGIPADRIVEPGAWPHVEADELVVPTPHSRAGSWAVEYLRGLFLRDHPAGGGAGRRLYVSRAGATARRVLNEAELLPLLEARGFERVEAEGLTVAEQATLFAQAEMVVGPHGAGLTNTVFCPPGAAVLELRATEHRSTVVDCFLHLSGFAGLRHYLLFCEGRGEDARMRSFNLDMVADLRLFGALLDRMEADASVIAGSALAPAPQR